MASKIPFFDLFKTVHLSRGLSLALADAYFTSAELNRQQRSMSLALTSTCDLGGHAIEELKQSISGAYGLNAVKIDLTVEAPVLETVKSSAPSGKEKEQGEVIMGAPIRATPIPMVGLNPKMGQVTVAGKVFFSDLYETRRPGVFCLTFDMTDYQSSCRVTKYLQKAEKDAIKTDIKPGMWLKVQGFIKLNRDGSDVLLDPRNISTYPSTMRQDTAEVKRVELHLHTSFSNMDATSPLGPKNGPDANIVKRAEAWGHPAVAITDHGVVQGFPDAQHSAKNIKLIYGMEGYFVNNLDDRIVVHGDKDFSFTDEYVAFDIETTGLSVKRDAITEIGAVVIQNGQVGERFQTFVNPNRRLTPEIIALTGITDDMLKDAPQLKEALTAFLEFVGDRPLVAHNAEFDIGFIREGCRKVGFPFQPTYVDTLILAQNLLPELGKYKLDIVAEHLKLPAFQHHRASDDAATCGLFLPHFFEKLEGMGVHSLQTINAVMGDLRAVRGTHNRRPRHIILLARNKTGLKNLYQLISLSNLKYFKRVPIIPKSELAAHREGLIIGSACEAGELFQAVTEYKDWSELKRIASFYDYLEIQPICNNAFMLREGKVKDEEELREFNRTVVRLGEELGKPVCATGDVHFLDPEDEIYRHILLASKGFEDADSPLPLYFKTTGEMLEEFSYLGEEKAYEVVVRNTNLVADWCEDVVPLPKGLFAPKIENSAEELTRLVWDKAKALYGEEPPQIVVDRINAELGDIIKCKYDVIYMSAQKLVQDSLDHGYLVGSRGSVGSSLVAFMSGITEVNSLPPHYRCPKCKHSDFEAAKELGIGCGADMPDANCPVCGTPYDKDGFNIPFETFLGFGGDKVPDIDLNFSGEYQSSAHRYTFELFGQTHVFRAGTIGTVKDKIAFGYVKHYLDDHGLHGTRAEENRLSLGCSGVKRTTGQHPGGMVVIPQNREIYDFCPVQHPADDPDSDIITTHFEYHSMESNLLKLDMLGHDDPTMIRMLQDLTGVDPQKIPLDDKDTMSIFTSSKVLGFEDDPILGPTGAVAIPEFNTKFTRGMLMDTQPHQFDILLRLSGFSHGTDVWLGNARDLIVDQGIPVGQAIGCRDDIMIFLISCGMPEKRSFKIMEAVRKGRGLPEGAEEEMKAAGVPDWYIGSCKKIKYLFPKAHAVAYVMMAFRIAWFKVHHPLAFYAAFFSIRAKAFDATCMCMGMDVCKAKMKEIESKEKPTPVEEDTLVTLEVVYEFYLRGFTFEHMDLYRSHAINFLPDMEKGTLLPPFTSIPGLGETAALSIMEQRQGKRFISIEEFSAACPKVSKTHIEQLKAVGALDGMPDTSQITLFDGF